MTKRHFVIASFALLCAVASTLAQQNPYLGRWNVTGTGENSNYVYWLEVKDEGGKLSGMLLNRGGHPLPLPVIKIENGELVFQPDGGRSGPGPEFHMRAQGDRLTGNVKLGDRTVELAGARPPKRAKYSAKAQQKLGQAVDLFDGKSMDVWEVQTKKKPMNWTIDDGAMT